MHATLFCLMCHTPKPLDQFYRSDIERRSARCKQCRNAVQRERWQRCKALVDSLKDTPCPDCGIHWPTECMEFDHRDPAEKDIAISRIVASGSMSRLERELAKGEFVCSNCHRIRSTMWGSRIGATGRATKGEFLRRIAHQPENDERPRP